MRLLGSAAAALLAMLIVSSAAGHSEPERVLPGSGAVLNDPPAEVVLLMTQEMTRQAGANDIDVFDATGQEITTVAATIDNADRRRLTVLLPATIAPGEYTVRWKTLSAEDGDTAEGSYSFTFDPERPANAGTEVVRESVLGPRATATPEVEEPQAFVQDDEDGVTWILVVAVAIVMFVLGAGASFLLVQKRP